MLYLSKNMRVLAPTVENDWKHREELLSFDPSESLYDSTYAGEKLEAASLWLYRYCCLPYCGSWLKYIPAGVSFFSILTHTGIPALCDEGDAFEEKSEKEPSD